MSKPSSASSEPVGAAFALRRLRLPVDLPRGIRRGVDDPELILEVAPFLVGPAVRAHDPGGSAGIDPAVQRLVAFPKLLPCSRAKPRLVRTVTDCSATNCFSHSFSSQCGRWNVAGEN